MPMKKIKALIFSLLAALVLTGCCVPHQWSEPGCAQSQYCLKCGRESGYMKDHVWLPADCTQPRRCADCGLASSVPLGHRVENGVCLNCGERLQNELPEFEKYSIAINLRQDEVLPFTTATETDPQLFTTGEIALGGFGLIPPDEQHPEKEGYEWCYVLINASFYDENARAGGVSLGAVCEDYYNITLCGSTEHTDGEGMKVHSVIVDGEELRLRYRRQGGWSGWQENGNGRRENLYTSLWEIQRPKGYDGVVLGLCSSYVNRPEGSYINEVYDENAFFLFRLG